MGAITHHLRRRVQVVVATNPAPSSGSFVVMVCVLVVWL
jgi:hypothetical protein